MYVISWLSFLFPIVINEVIIILCFRIFFPFELCKQNPFYGQVQELKSAQVQVLDKAVDFAENQKKKKTNVFKKLTTTTTLTAILTSSLKCDTADLHFSQVSKMITEFFYFNFV